MIGVFGVVFHSGPGDITYMAKIDNNLDIIFRVPS
jgi:hypothetical protein